MQDNPFQAPQARVADVMPGAADYSPDGRRVGAGNGLSWISAGWELFRQAPGTWIVLSVVLMILTILLSLIPLLNVVVNLLVPVFMGGIMLGCRALDDGEELRVGHLFAAFSGHAGKLVLLGLLYLAGMLAIMVVVFLLMGISGFAAFTEVRNAKAAIGTFVLPILVGVALMVPLAASIWFAPALVVLQDMSSLQAMKASLFAGLKNFLPFLVYGLVIVVLAVVASIPILLGWLALMPVMYASIYTSYKDVFARA
jgi:uncharacterized membrane protein